MRNCHKPKDHCSRSLNKSGVDFSHTQGIPLIYQPPIFSAENVVQCYLQVAIVLHALQKARSSTA